MKHAGKLTRERVLDVAERLFAQKGFHCTSTRTLAREAQVNLAAIHYHFGSKETLLEKVIERRLCPLNHLCMERLTAVRETAVREGRRPKANDVLRAFIEPTFAFNESLPSNRSFLALEGKAISENGTVRTIFTQQIEPLFSLLFNIMKEAMPDLPEDVLFWRLHFTIGATGHAMQMFANRMFVPDEITLVDDATTMTDMLLTFVTNGISGRR
jgi:AcrR family transcriptional regulator